MSDGGWDAALSWLRAQLDGEERLADAAGRIAGRRWEGLEDGIHSVDDPLGFPTAPFIDDPADGFLDLQLAKYIAAHDPDHVLRRIESDRLALMVYDKARDDASHDAESEARFYLMCDVVKAMAHRFADLPGFPEVLRMDEDATP
jgi:hypothetical protein